MIDGSTISVTSPLTAIIIAMKNPTVLYGISGAKRSGVKPMAMTTALRIIALTGSSKSVYCRPSPFVSLYICLARWTRCMAKSTDRPRVRDESTAIGMS